MSPAVATVSTLARCDQKAVDNLQSSAHGSIVPLSRMIRAVSIIYYSMFVATVLVFSRQGVVVVVSR